MTDKNDDKQARDCKAAVMPWAKRAMELKEQEGPYCDYAAWCEWFDSSNERLPESMKLEIDVMDAIDRAALYHLFATACRATVAE